MISPLFADISSNNGEFWPGEYFAAGYVFVAIKATEGTQYVNPDHKPYCYAAGYRQIGIMHYHFARPDLNDFPEDEARHFLRTALPLAGGRDYLALDLERATPQGWNHDPGWSYKFDAYIQAQSRFSTILYANRSTLQSVQGDWLVGNNKRVWEADWSTDNDYAPPGYTVAARQQSGVTAGVRPFSLPGIGPCDVNVARGKFWQQILQHAPRA